MSGHSKWATIKRKKGAADAKRGQVFTKLIREITIAARQGGGDPNGNPRLRTAVDKAREANMPQDNVTRAIKKGTGELEGTIYEESVLEAYGPGGVAMMLEITTDNKNRTLSEIRHCFTRNGGNLGAAGCVAWVFSKKGAIRFDKASVTEERLMEVALDAGAEDIRAEEDTWDVMTDPAAFEAVRERLKKAGLTAMEAEITMVPQNTVRLVGADAEKMLRLMESLEEHDDVQNVYANFDIAKEEMERLSSKMVA